MAKKEKSQIAKDILRRVRWLYVLFLLAAISIFARVIWIQYGPQGEVLREKAQRITFERVNIEAERGDILANDGRILATSIPTYEIRMDFAAAGLADSIFNKSVDSLAYRLSDFFKDKSASAYRKMLVSARENKQSNRYKLISPRRVNFLEEKQIKEFPLFRLGPNKGGYIKVKINKRMLPHGTLAERTIGMTNQSGVKLGIEGAFDEQLRGTDGTTMMQRVSGSFRVPVNDPMNVEPVHGMDIVSTINIDLQDVAETALKEQLEKGAADWGTVVLMEVATGEIHAMSNLTRKGPGVYKEDFNYAIGRRIEPGSTFKLATLIALLEDAGMSLDEMIDCENGKARVGRRVITDDHKESVISLRRVFEVSSNIGFAKSVHKHYDHDPARFVDFINNMGMGKPLGIDISGEQNPLIKHPSDKKSWDGTSLVMMSYGYALEITPMHTLALFNAVANGGKLMRPKLVKEVRNYGQTVEKFDSETVNPAICSPATLKLVKECLEGVVDEGTGRALKNDHYTVAAKTGTAQVAFNRGGYMDSRGGRNYLATMVGYFPADNPKYSCIVAIKTYHGPGNRNTYYGASLSGPVFRQIADRVYASNTAWHEAVDYNSDRLLPEEKAVKGGRSSEFRAIASRIDLPFQAGREQNQWIYPGNDWNVVSTETQDINPDGESPILQNTVPVLVGLGLKDAVYLVENMGMTAAFSGKGRVVSQNPAAGTPAVSGQVVHFTLGS